MTTPREPRSTLYDGALYGHVIERLLGRVHGFVAERLPEGERVLEACCGTGGLARRLAESGRRVHGVDLSPRNIDFARARNTSLDPEQLSYEVRDVSTVEPPPEGPYDVATIVLALHEMPSAGRVAVLRALLRAARRVMVVDFAVPMPRNLAGLRNRAMELAAGREHFGGFRDYTRRGGLPALFEETGARVEWERRLDADTLHVAVVRGNGSAQRAASPQ